MLDPASNTLKVVEIGWPYAIRTWKIDSSKGTAYTVVFSVSATAPGGVESADYYALGPSGSHTPKEFLDAAVLEKKKHEARRGVRLPVIDKRKFRNALREVERFVAAHAVMSD